MVLLRGLLRLVGGLFHRAGMFQVLRALALLFLAAPSVAAAEGLRLCYREDAAPFSHVDEAGQATGYSVDLCRRIAAAHGDDAPAMVPVTSETRFTALGPDCQLLCEATTITLSRRARMDFTLITFLTASALLYPRSLPAKGAAALRVGFLKDTTTDRRWQSGELIGGQAWDFEFEGVDSHDRAGARLKAGTLDAYIADREILEHIMDAAPGLRETHQIGLRSISYEPYAIAVAPGERALLLTADRTLAGLFRSGEIDAILGRHVPQRRFDPALNDLFKIQSIPD
ncbi:MAG: transporter substrate-binding domain-containing protein [Pseudooceanicola sp.]